MLDSLVTTRVEFHPGVDLEYILILDEDGLSICDEGFNLSHGHNGVYTPRGRRFACGHLDALKNADNKLFQWANIETIGSGQVTVKVRVDTPPGQ